MEKMLRPAQTMSFLSLVNDFAICIPVIQRDYAQGRRNDDVDDIRENFVHDLLSYIKDTTQSHHIDFVYGTIEHKENKKPDVFIPLDGQQRLTTLFLLHLYLAGVSGNYASFQDKVQGKFEYFTRKTSTEFCREIISHNVFDDLKEKRKKQKTSLSKVIENQGWFFTSWKQDPTVAGMLVMLDEIDRQIEQGKEDVQLLFDCLYNPQSHPPVVFQWQPLDGYTRTDDLYIKMNARGLKLTDFENFKASYEKSIEICPQEDQNIFINDIDGDWCDFLWQRKGELPSSDKLMERIIRLMIAFGVAGKITGKEVENQNTLDKLFGRNKQDIPFSYSRYRSLGILHDISTKNNGEKVADDQKEKETHILRCIIEAMQIVCDKENSPIVAESQCKPRCDEKEIVKKILCCDISELTYDELVYFYAYTSFSSRYNKSRMKDELPEWMRYIYNLLNSNQIDNSVQLSRIVKSIDKIIDSIKDERVLVWVKSNPNVDAFPGNQSYEEAVKAKLLLWSESEEHSQYGWRGSIIEDEEDHYMRGQIGFLLLFSDIYKLEKEYSVEHICKSLEYFKNVSKKARSIYSHFRKENDKLMSKHLLERALLTKGMYLKMASSGRFNFCNRPYDRDNSWRKMLEVDFKQDLNNLPQSLKAMRDLLDDELMNDENVEDSLKEIIGTYNSNNDKNNWYDPFISEDYGIKLIEICRQGYIQKTGSHITLLHESQMNHYHSELQSRILYIDLKKEYSFIHYRSVRSREDNPGIYFDLKSEDKGFLVHIYNNARMWYLKIYDKDANEVNAYQSGLSDILGLTSEDNNEGNVKVTRDKIVEMLSSINMNIVVLQ